MNGTPVWLASLSRRAGATLKPVGQWTPLEMQRAYDLMGELLHGLGNPDRERHFRMNATACVHRALSDKEQEQLPDWFKRAEARHMAGGPVLVLWENVPGALSTRPCDNPGREGSGDLWIPIDCGKCPSCLARKESIK